MKLTASIAASVVKERCQNGMLSPLGLQFQLHILSRAAYCRRVPPRLTSNELYLESAPLARKQSISIIEKDVLGELESRLVDSAVGPKRMA